MIRSYYCCCCINEPVIFSHCVHLKLGHRFHALLKACSDRDDIVPLRGRYNIDNYQIIKWINYYYLKTYLMDHLYQWFVHKQLNVTFIESVRLMFRRKNNSRPILNIQRSPHQEENRPHADLGPIQLHIISGVRRRGALANSYTLKTPRLDLTQKSVRGGPDPFWGQTYPESRSDWPGIRVKKTFWSQIPGHFDPDSRSLWPKNGSGPMGPFSGSNLTREFSECTTT